jgi:hypothetical protein
MTGRNTQGEMTLTLRAKVAIPVAALGIVLSAAGGWVTQVLTERGEMNFKVDRLERDVKDIKDDIGIRLHRVEATLNRIEGRLERD